MFDGETSRWMMAIDAPVGVAPGVRVGEARQHLEHDVHRGGRREVAPAQLATRRMIVRRSTPRTYSMTMNSDSSDSTRSKMWTMLAWSSVAEILASRKNRSRNSGRDVYSGRSCLSTTSFSKPPGPSFLPM